MQSDVTQSEGYYKLLTWFELNKTKVIYGTAAAIVVGVIVWFVLYQKSQTQVRSGEALSQVFVSQITGADDRSQAAASYLKVASEFPETEAAAKAILLAASTLFTEGKFAEAQREFERLAREHRDSPFLGQAQLGIAASLDAQGKDNEAITAYKTVADRRSNEAVGTQAKFALARLYVKQGKHELAYPLYEDLARAEPFSSIGSEAGMLAEELKQKHPELAPKPEPAVQTITLPPQGTNVVITNVAPAQPAKQ